MRFKIVAALSNILALKSSSLKIHLHLLRFYNSVLFISLKKILKIHYLFVDTSWGKSVSQSDLALIFICNPIQINEMVSIKVRLHWLPWRIRTIKLYTSKTTYSHTLCTHFITLFALCTFTWTKRNFQSKQIVIYSLKVSYNVSYL